MIAENQSIDKKQLAPVENAKFITLSVTDTRTGIAPELLPTIFNEGVSSKVNGHGIGLFTVKRIVLLHGGQITVDSTPGTGTSFRIMLSQRPNHAKKSNQEHLQHTGRCTPDMQTPYEKRNCTNRHYFYRIKNCTF